MTEISNHSYKGMFDKVPEEESSQLWKPSEKESLEHCWSQEEPRQDKRMYQ